MQVGFSACRFCSRQFRVGRFGSSWFRGFEIRCWRLSAGRCRATGSGEGIDPLAAATAASLAASLAATTIPIATATAGATTTTATGGRRALVDLGALLVHQLLQLTRFQLLGQGAQRKAEHGHGGAQSKGFLQGPGGLQFVIAQADAETTGIALASLGLPPLALTAFALSALARTSLPTTASRFLGTSVGLGSVGVVSHARSTHSGASVPHRATGRISFGVKPVQTVLAGRRDRCSGQHQQRQGAVPLAMKVQAVLLNQGEVALQGPALVAALLSSPEPLQCFATGVAAELVPTLLLGLPSLQACRQELAIASQFGRITTGIGGKPVGQLIDANTVQAQPAAIEQQHRQSAMPARLLLLLGQTTLQLLPLARSQAHQGIHHQALSLRT